VTSDRWPAPLLLDEVRDVKALDYEVADLLMRKRGDRVLWNTEQGLFLTFTPEVRGDETARRWVRNGENGELAQHQVNLFAREMVDLVDDRVEVINGRLAEIDTDPDAGVEEEAEADRLRREKAELKERRDLVDGQRDRWTLANLVKQEPRQHVRLRELDGNPHLLNFLNGTYDVRTGELRPHAPADRITHLVPHELDVELIGKPVSETAPLFWGMVWRACSAGGEKSAAEHDELAAAVMRWLGYSLHGSNPEKKMAIFKGASNIGKTQMVEVAHSLLSDQLAWPTASPKLITAQKQARHDAVTSPLAGKRMVLIDELHRKQHLDEHMILQLVSPEGSGIELRLMRKDSFAALITWAITVTTNDLPQTELPPQVRNRMLIFELSRISLTEAQQDRQLTAKILATEAGAVLAGLVGEWRAWWLAAQEAGVGTGGTGTGLVVPGSVTAALDEYREQNRNLGELFVEERCEVGEEAAGCYVKASNLWRYCQTYMDDQFRDERGVKRVGRNEFYDLIDKLPGIQRKVKLRGAAKPQLLGWHNIKLLPPDEASREQLLVWSEIVAQMRTGSE